MLTQAKRNVLPVWWRLHLNSFVISYTSSAEHVYFLKLSLELAVNHSVRHRKAIKFSQRERASVIFLRTLTKCQFVSNTNMLISDWKYWQIFKHEKWWIITRIGWTERGKSENFPQWFSLRSPPCSFALLTFGKKRRDASSQISPANWMHCDLGNISNFWKHAWY